MADDLLSLGRHVLATQPFSVLLGTQALSFVPGHVELALPIKAEFAQQHGFVHGGVISYLADNALTFVGGSVLGPAVVTAGYTINYVKPARGVRLVAKADVVAAGKRQAVCRCEVWVTDADGEYLCAVAQGTISTLSPQDEASVG